MSNIGGQGPATPKAASQLDQTYSHITANNDLIGSLLVDTRSFLSRATGQSMSQPTATDTPTAPDGIVHQLDHVLRLQSQLIQELRDAGNLLQEIA